MTADLDLIRRAANQMRELAEGVIPGPWEAGEHCIWALSKSPSLVYTIVSDGEAGDGGVTDEDTTAYLASWHPAVALAVADVLDAVADAWPVSDPDYRTSIRAEAVGHRQALTLARAFLKEDA